MECVKSPYWVPWGEPRSVITISCDITISCLNWGPTVSWTGFGHKAESEAHPPPGLAHLPAHTVIALPTPTPSLVPTWCLPCTSRLQQAQGRCGAGAMGPVLPAAPALLLSRQHRGAAQRPCISAKGIALMQWYCVDVKHRAGLCCERLTKSHLQNSWQVRLKWGNVCVTAQFQLYNQVWWGSTGINFGEK